MINEKIILGIDPGTNVDGLWPHQDCIQQGTNGIYGHHRYARYVTIFEIGQDFERVTGIIDEYLPDEMAIEAPFFGKERSVDVKPVERRVWQCCNTSRHSYP